MPKIKFHFETSIVLIILFSVILFFLGRQIPKEAIQQYVENFGPLAPVVYIILHQVSFVLAPINGFPFLIAGFYLFGKTVIIYNYFVMIIGSTINFVIAKRWGRPIVKRFVGGKTLEKIDSLSQTYGKTTLISLRVLMGGMADFVSYAYGLTDMKFSTYFAITALATIPGNVLWYYIISKTDNTDLYISISLFLAALSIIIFLIGSYLVKLYKKLRS
ncbi:TVP38/TMEM64 family protein [Candidatus Microgenomates bacterium]|nr:TVP38/TMEM64 family protein [Candidatus Microgenomates bacterium]